MIGPCPWPGCPNRTAFTRSTRTRGTSTPNLGRDTRARQSGADFLGSQILKICDDGSNDYIRPRMEPSSTYRCPRLLRMITSPQSSRENLSLYFSCAVKRRGQQRGKTRPGTGSLHPVAIGAVVEVTKLLKPLVQRVALGDLASFSGRNESER